MFINHLVSLHQPRTWSIFIQNRHDLHWFRALSRTHFIPDIRAPTSLRCKNNGPETSSKNHFCAGFKLLRPFLPASESLRDVDHFRKKHSIFRNLDHFPPQFPLFSIVLPSKLRLDRRFSGFSHLTGDPCRCCFF